jgi:YjbE family integral membrane protein
MDSVHFLIGVCSLVLLDLLLAGDNALVIAMAMRSLPPRERRIGSICGAGLAVAMRIALTAVASRLFRIPYVQIVGGLLILWIALKVLVDASDPPAAAESPTRLRQAIWYIAFADLTMSIDNIFAIAAAAHGNTWLIIFGLCLSIPFVVFSANLLAKLMDRYPLVIYLGAAVLGQVGGEMILKDPLVMKMVPPGDVARYVIEGAIVAAVLVAGKALSRGRPAGDEK